KNKPILVELCARFNFKGIDFVQALRNFLTAFWLPGEGQAIERVTDVFAEQYCRDNSAGHFACPAAASVFAYAVIMLNTELHSQVLGNRQRMTVEQFLINNKGLNKTKDGPPQDYPEEMQIAAYNSIKERQLDLVEVTPPLKK